MRPMSAFHVFVLLLGASLIFDGCTVEDNKEEAKREEAKRAEAEKEEAEKEESEKEEAKRAEAKREEAKREEDERRQHEHQEHLEKLIEEECRGLRKQIEKAEEMVEEVRKTVEERQNEIEFMRNLLDCYRLRDELIDAWLKHKPISGLCSRQRWHGGRRVCAGTGLPPNTVTPYSKRLSRLKQTLRERPEYLAKKFAELGPAPVPTVDAFWVKEKKDKEAYIAERALADSLTHKFLGTCAPIIWGRKVPIPEARGR